MPSEATGQPAAGRSGLQAIGEHLAARRAELGLDLAAVEDAIKIRTRYLQSLESGQPDELPGPVYAIGFVRAYGDLLGLDGASLAAQYRGFLSAGQTHAGSPASPSPSGPPGAAAPPVLPRNGGLAAPVSFTPPAPVARLAPRYRPVAVAGGVSRRRWWLGAALIAAVLLGVYVAAVALRPAPEPADPGEQDPGGQGPGGGTTEPVLLPSMLATSTGAAGELRVVVDWQVLEIVLKCAERVWMRADADGLRVVDGTYQAGATVSIEASDRVEIRLGRARPTAIWIGGLELGPAGPTDDARTVIVTRRQ